jgi:type III pantothenate kinase
MDLVIDIGNTLKKVAIFSEKGKLIQLFHEKRLTVEFLEPLFEEFSIRRAIVSSVGDEEAEALAWIESRAHLVRFTHNCCLPIKLDYATPETLGTDRIANAVGAHALYPNHNVLSIMAGTCLVADFVNTDGEYLGGSISPGLRMRFQALSQFTARLPLVEPEEIVPLIGDTTQKSILAGVVLGMAYEIDGLIADYKGSFSPLKVIFSGGDSDLLRDFIKKRIFAAPNPILLGLHKILELNASED